MTIPRTAHTLAPRLLPALALSLAILVLPGICLGQPVCEYCGREITGEYIQYESHAYHVTCYENNVALRCSLCGGIIDGLYYTDSRDNTFHDWHEEEYDNCAYCGCLICRELTDGGTKYQDGRHVCGLCLITAVNSIQSAQSLMEKAVNLLKGVGIDIDEEELPLELVDVPGMKRVSKGSAEDAVGFTTFKKQSFLSGLVAVRDFKIYVLEGMPRTKCLFSIAHELMHVWLFKNAPDDMEPILREGSCDYAATLVILASGEDEAARVWRQAMENPDPIYGEGLRQVDAYVTRSGVPTWLDYLKGHTSPPW